MDPDLGGLNSALDSVTPMMAQPARPTDLVDTFFPLPPPSSRLACISSMPSDTKSNGPNPMLASGSGTTGYYRFTDIFLFVFNFDCDL